MTAMGRIHDFLGVRRIAMAGVSRRPPDFSRSLFRDLRQRGYDVVPVNPQAQEIDGVPCFASLRDVSPPVDGALLMTPPALAETMARDCAAARIPRVWIYRAGGRRNFAPDAVHFCESNGISVIPGECPYMFLPATPWFHRVHGLIQKITGAYPH